MAVRREGVCPNCGHDDSDENLFFDCEWCGRAICSYCHRMTSDMDMVCQQCVDEKGIPDSELEI